jgi:hemerythrin
VETFIWTPDFETGVARIDEQHRQLVALINELGSTLVEGGRGPDVPPEPAVLEHHFDQLETYARLHFAEEEAWFEARGLDGDELDRHQELHDQFIHQVATMWRTRASMKNPDEVSCGFLSAWLAFHILGEDQMIVRALRDDLPGIATPSGSGEGPARASGATKALLSALNNLYHVLSEQNRDLSEANAHLEARVTDRTRELALANEALLRMARTDGLLDIANRLHFNERLELEWGRARRTGSPLGLVMIDVDHFKRYNDRHGHLGGDACLRRVADAVAAGIRRSTDFLARYGGEELAIILPETDERGAVAVARAVLASVRAMALPHGASPTAAHVTVSVGVATSRNDGSTGPERLVARADDALYAAKHQGRDRYAVAEGE